MKRFLSMKLAVATAIVLTSGGLAQADIVLTTQFFDVTDTASAQALVSNTDLLQTAIADPDTNTSATTTDGEAIGVGTRRVGLFNGFVGDGTPNTNEADYVRADTGDTLTAVFDTSLNTLGYDITGITGVANWDDRSDLGFSVDLGFVDGTTATLLSSGFWADQDPQDSTQHYAVASFVDSTGGVLNNNADIMDDTLAAIAATNVVATGVESITFTFNNLRNPGILGEFDVVGVATTAVPEPSSLTVLGLCSLVMLRRRRSA